MSAVQPGGKGSGQRPGPGRTPTAKRPQTQGKRLPVQGKRPPGKPPQGGRGGGGKAGAARQNMRVTAAPPRRFSPTTVAFASVAVVIVVVVALVIVKVAGGNSAPKKASTSFPAPAALVSQVTSVPDSVATSVGTASVPYPPTVLRNQPPLTSNGKPEVLFIGAEFCPLCAAERWAVVMALSKFGTFANLSATNSSPWDSPPAVSTFSFYGSTYTSQYIDFVSVEHETNDTNGLGTRAILQPTTAAQSNLWNHYSSVFGIRTGYPFMDLGNKVFVTGPSYLPDVLAGLSHQDIAAKLTNPSDPVTQAIVGTSNYLTAAICSLTGQQPTSVCSTTAVHEAAAKLHVS